MSKYEELFELLEELVDAEVGRPESCACHINPPCSHCCYELANDATTAVDMYIKENWDD